MIFHSIRWRILAWNFLLLAATATVLLLAFYRHEKQNRYQAVDLSLRQIMTVEMGAVIELAPNLNARGTPPPPPPERNGGQARARPAESNTARKSRAEDSINALAAQGVWVWAANVEGATLYRSANAPQEDRLLNLSIEAVHEDNAGPGPVHPKDAIISEDAFEILVHRPPGQNLVAFGVSTQKLTADLRQLGWELFFAGFGLTIVGCSIGWILAGRSLRPLDRIATDAEGIAHGDFGRRIDLEDTESELGRLAVVLNSTFTKMNEARENVAQFTADASHELRTPLTVILSESQGALRQPRTPVEYQASLEAIKQSALRMKSISDALLELAQGDAGRPVAQDACDLADLADETVALLGRLAKENGATLVGHLDSAPVLGDPSRLSRMILNLVMNAMLHNPPGVQVAVTTKVMDGQALLTVVDNGQGITPDNLNKIFERFHRADPSRSRHTGGAGLGLAIVKQTIEAHRGTIEVASELGKGTTFTVRLPLRS
jgi:signal transduction histidine kinase